MTALGRIKALLKIQAALGKFQGQHKGEDMKTLFRNWKTTLAGVVTLVATAGSTLGFLGHDQVNAIMALAVSFGLMAAKDGNVTGGSQ